MWSDTITRDYLDQFPPLRCDPPRRPSRPSRQDRPSHALAIWCAIAAAVWLIVLVRVW